MAKILIVDDDSRILGLASSLAFEVGYRPVSAPTFESGMNSIGFDLRALVTDFDLKPGDGTQLLEHFRAYHPTAPAVLMSGHESHPKSGEKMTDVAKKYNATFLYKPFTVGDYLRAIGSPAS